MQAREYAGFWKMQMRMPEHRAKLGSRRRYRLLARASYAGGSEHMQNRGNGCGGYQTQIETLSGNGGYEIAQMELWKKADLPCCRTIILRDHHYGITAYSSFQERRISQGCLKKVTQKQTLLNQDPNRGCSRYRYIEVLGLTRNTIS